MTVRQYLSFRVGHQWYGIEVDHILEVLHFVALSELPGSLTDVLGLMTLREEVMPVVDLRLRFGASETPLSLDTPIIAVRTPHGPLGLVVDDADDVEEVTSEQTADGHRAVSPYVNGVARLSGRLLLILDTALLRAETALPNLDEG